VPWAGDPVTQDRNAVFHPPDSSHWLGTDGFGRDVMARLTAGTRLSLLAGLLGTSLALVCAVLAGAMAGYFGGWRDRIVMHLAELFQSLPWLWFLLGIRALLPLSLSPAAALMCIALVAGLTAWPRPARLLRGVVRSTAQRDYVTAARAFGGGDLYLLRRHIIPEAAPVLLVQAVTLLPQFILAEVTLSFLGLGIGEPSPSLGGMLSVLRDLHVAGAYPWMNAPVMVLVLLTLICQSTSTWLGATLRQ
jgi:peptide/nickel transport system permease protein